MHKTCQSLNTKKPSWIDGMLVLLLKKCTSKLAPIVTKLYQFSYGSRIFLITRWVHGFNSFQKKDPSDHRPVALLDRALDIAKIFSKVWQVAFFNKIHSVPHSSAAATKLFFGGWENEKCLISRGLTQT